MTVLATAVAAHPQAPPAILTALTQVVLTSDRDWGTVATAVALWANPATSDADADALHTTVRTGTALHFAGDAALAADTSHTRIHDLLTAVAPAQLLAYGTRRPTHPSFPRVALHAHIDAGLLTPHAATRFVTNPHLDADDVRTLVHHLLTGPDNDEALQAAITAATRVLPGELADLATRTRHARVATALAQYATAPRPHALRLADLAARALDGDRVAAHAILTDPGLAPEQAATLLTRLPGASHDTTLMRVAVLDTPHLAHTTAAWTAVVVTARGRDATPATTAEAALTAAGPYPHYAGMLTHHVLPDVTDPAALHTWATSPAAVASTEAQVTVVLHPYATTITRRRAAAALARAGYPVHRSWTRLGEDQGALAHCPVPALDAGVPRTEALRVAALTPALTPLLPHLAAPAVARAFAALEPNFTGTVTELVSAARAIAA